MFTDWQNFSFLRHDRGSSSTSQDFDLTAFKNSIVRRRQMQVSIEYYLIVEVNNK